MEVTTAPARANEECDREASLRPGPCLRRVRCPPVRRWRRSPSEAASSSASTRTPICSDSGTRRPASSRDSTSMSPARSPAPSSATPTASICEVVDASQRESALTSGKVDVVVRTYSVTCERKAQRRFLHGVLQRQPAHPRREGVRNRFCRRTCGQAGVRGDGHHLAVDTVRAGAAADALVGVATWTDCLVMLQQGQVDAISTDDAVLAGLARQDPNVEVVGAEHRRWSPTASGSTRRTRIWSGSSTVSWSRCVPTERGSASTKLAAELGPSPGPPTPATRTDHDAC